MAVATRAGTVAASVGVFVLVAAAAGWWFAGGSPANNRPPPTPGSSYSSILRADDHGAVVYDREALRGVTRAGRVVWSDAEAAATFADAVCVSTCPDVVVSSSEDSLRSPSAPDQEPRTLGDRLITGRSLSFTGLKNHILAVSARSVVRLVSETGDSFLLQTIVGSNVRSSVEVPSYDVVWLATVDGRQAVAEFYGRRAGIAVQRFESRHGVWVLAGPLREGHSHMACASGEGDLLLDRPLRLISPRGQTEPWPDFPAGGDCQFYRGGAVVAQYTQTSSAAGVTNGSVVTSADMSGRVRWSHSYDSEVRLAAGASSPFFAVIDEDVLSVHRPDGSVVDTLPEVDDATFVADGSLVVLSSGGSISWEVP